MNNNKLDSIDHTRLHAELYQVADDPDAREMFQRTMDRYKRNKGDLNNSWIPVAELLGRQIQIDLAQGYTIEEIMPKSRFTSEAVFENKRPGQLIQSQPNKNMVIGHYLNMLEFIIGTSVHGPVINKWFIENQGIFPAKQDKKVSHFTRL